MAVRKVPRSANNVANGTLVYELAAIVNQISAAVAVLVAQLDADAGVTDTDYEANVGEIDTIEFTDGGVPT